MARSKQGEWYLLGRLATTLNLRASGIGAFHGVNALLRSRPERFDKAFGPGHWRVVHIFQEQLLDEDEARSLLVEACVRALDAGLVPPAAKARPSVSLEGTKGPTSMDDLTTPVNPVWESVPAAGWDEILQRARRRAGSGGDAAAAADIRPLPFHEPDAILPFEKVPVDPGSMEAFWHANCVLAVDREGLVHFGRQGQLAWAEEFAAIHGYAEDLPALDTENATGTRWVFEVESGLIETNNVRSLGSEYRDAELLRPLLEPLRVGSAVSASGLELIYRYVATFQKDGRSDWEQLLAEPYDWDEDELEDEDEDKAEVAMSFRNTLLESIDLQVRHSLMMGMLQQPSVFLEFGGRFGAGEVFEHLEEVFARACEVIHAFSHLGHADVLRVLAQLLDCDVQLAVYYDSYNPDHHVPVMLTPQVAAGKGLALVAALALAIEPMAAPDKP